MDYCKDALLNIVLPMLAGVFFYAISDALPVMIQSHAADGMWAYAFASALLIIWQRKINYFWIFMAALTAVSFEMLQYRNMVRGTGDVLDMITYLLFILAAICLNAFFFHLFNYQNPIHE